MLLSIACISLFSIFYVAHEEDFNPHFVLKTSGVCPGTSMVDWWGNETVIYSVGNYDNGTAILVKWTRSGEIIWRRTWGIGESWALWCNGTHIFTVSNILVKWDGEGNQIWSKGLSDDIYDLWADNTSIYGIGSYLH